MSDGNGAFELRPYQRPRGVHPPLDSPAYRSSALRASGGRWCCCRTGSPRSPGRCSARSGSAPATPT
jgi:hypothetical protein